MSRRKVGSADLPTSGHRLFPPLFFLRKLPTFDFRLPTFLPLILATALLAGAENRLPGTRLLANDHLTVQVMDPDAPDRYNRGVRFTPVAAVLRAELGGRDYLFSPAQHDPIADHGGLAAEFDLCIPGGPTEDLPPGWKEAEVGGGFLKIGVGVLAKERQPYHLFRNPKALALATTTVTWEPAAARFHQQCPGVDGYAYELWAEVTLEESSIVVDWRLANTGSKPFITRQYSHNFIRLDDADVGPDYVLSFPYDITVTGLLPEQEAGTREIRFVRTIPRWVNLEVPWPAGYTGENKVTLTHTGKNMAITCTTSIPGIRTAVHARAPYCSPEQFVALPLAPSAEMRWQRSYRLR